MNRPIEVFDHTTEIMNAVKTGVLLVTQAGEKTNAMTISWGTLGIIWGKPIFTTFVREHRFTHNMLEQNPEFTISIPQGAYDKKILALCGTKSGRDLNKIEAAHLTLVKPHLISVPAIKELPLTLECRVVYSQKQDEAALPANIVRESYPANVDSSFPGSNKDFHTAFCGEIVSAYVAQ